MRKLFLLLLIAGAAGWWFKRGAPPALDGIVEGPAGGVQLSGDMPPEMRQALEAAAREATSPEDFERRVREIEARMAAQAAGVAPSPSGGGTRYALEPFNERYDKVGLQGWSVRVSKELTANADPLAQAALAVIDKQLSLVAETLPASRLASLRLVPVWLEYRQSGQPARYLWTTEGHLPPGYDVSKANGVDIPDAQDFIMNARDQPGIMLHELSHAYHHRALGADNPDIRRAYENAMGKGLYASVKDITGATLPAYAKTNEREYFAEITEAYFLKNDFFPFTRAELRDYDPEGYALVEAVWLRR